MSYEKDKSRCERRILSVRANEKARIKRNPKGSLDWRSQKRRESRIPEMH